MNKVRKGWALALTLLMLACFALCAVCLTGRPAAAAEENIAPFTGFEDGKTTGAVNWGGSTVVSINENAQFVHGGNKSLKLPMANWYRLNFGLNNAERWEANSYYRLSFWVKSSAAGTAMTVYLAYTGTSPQDEIMPWSNAAGAFGEFTEWKQVNLDVAYTYDGETTEFDYYFNGKKFDTAWATGGSIDRTELMININGAGDVYLDDVVLVKQPLTADTKVNVLTADGTPVEGATLTVSDSAGEALAVQPEIVYSGGAYTIKALPFASYNTEYRVVASKSGVNLPTAGAKITGDAGEGEITIANYSASVTVKDSLGTAVTDAVVSTVENGQTIAAAHVGEGVYRFENLSSADVVTVGKDGFNVGYADVSPAKPAASVILYAVRETVAVTGDMIQNGDFEAASLGGAGMPWHGGGKIELTKRVLYSGVQGAAMTGNVLHRFDAAMNAGDGTVYSFEAYVRSDAATSISVSMDYSVADSSEESGWGHPQLTVVKDAVVGTEFTRINGTFSASYDDASRKLTLVGFDGKATEKIGGSIAGADMIFSVPAGATIYFDDIRVLPCYSAGVTVLGSDGKPVTDATFSVKDFAGREMDAPKLDGTVYRFENLYGPVSVVATSGQKVYDEVKLTDKLNEVTIEDSYTITLTLKDQNGELVKDAAVKARKGAVEVGVFADNGDGTYTLKVMGTVSIVVIKDGYTFARKDNVTAAGATLTMTGERDEQQQTPEPEPKGCGGCGSIGFGGTSGFFGLIVLCVFSAVVLSALRGRKRQ